MTYKENFQLQEKRKKKTLLKSFQSTEKDKKQKLKKKLGFYYK
jgi:hypothetical protein